MTSGGSLGICKAGSEHHTTGLWNGVLRKEHLGQLPQIEPSERCVSQGTAVEIEAIYAEDW